MSSGSMTGRHRAGAFEAMTRALGAGMASPSGLAECGAMSSSSSPRGAGRPVGAFGDVSRALLASASSAGPGTVRDLAERACVGAAVARYTASRLVSRGELVPLSTGRPMVLAAAGVRSFWEEAVAEAAADDGDAVY